MSFEEYFSKVALIGDFLLKSFVDLWNVMIANPMLAMVLSVVIIALIVSIVLTVKNIK